MTRTLIAAALALACIAPAAALEVRGREEGAPASFCLKSGETSFCAEGVREIAPYREGNLRKGEICLKDANNSFCLRPVTHITPFVVPYRDDNGVSCDSAGNCSTPMSRARR